MKWLVRLAVVSGLLLLSIPASAQTTPYPPGPGVLCTNGTDVDLGTMNVGETRAASLCGPWTGFVSFNKEGQPAGGKNANTDGTVPVAVTTLSQTQANVDDIVAERCGRNSMTATGASAIGGGTITRNVFWTLNCVNNIAVVSPFPFANPTFPNVALPISQQQQQQQQQIIGPGAGAPAAPGAAAPAPAAAGGGSSMRFTGANVLRWTIVSLALVGLGCLLVLSGRGKARARLAQ